jgi:hypothetical protein
MAAARPNTHFLGAEQGVEVRWRRDSLSGRLHCYSLLRGTSIALDHVSPADAALLVEGNVQALADNPCWRASSSDSFWAHVVPSGRSKRELDRSVQETRARSRL